VNEQEVSNVYAHFSTYSSMIIGKHTIFVMQASPKRSNTTEQRMSISANFYFTAF